MLKLSKEVVIALESSGVKEKPDLPIVRSISEKFPFKMFTGTKRKRSQVYTFSHYYYLMVVFSGFDTELW